MKVSLKWIKDYVDISRLSNKVLSERLSLAGLEVEGMQSIPRIEGIFVGKVESAEKHPNADKLKVCMVNDGQGIQQVVCGAPNVAAGQTIVFARPGAVLPGNFKIKEAEIRGVKSCGMICSERELNISEEHDGIMVLDNSHKPGTDANTVLALDDTVLELGITPNRGDCLSVYGVARDVSAIFNRDLAIITFAVVEDDAVRASSMSRVLVEDFEGCPFYSARIIKGVKVGESPQWLKNRLRSAGMRPVNNVVDVTNYVMLEFGQPMHGFDLSVIDKGIVVRRANKGETLMTLDGKNRALDESMTVIADHSKILGLAGVMGGEHSGINENTVDILLESAYFNPVSVARTSRKLGLNTDSAYRFARRVDCGSTRTLLDYAASLMCGICGGKVLSGALTSGEEPAKVHTVVTKITKINRLIGKNLSKKIIANFLSRLGMLSVVSGDKIAVTVPSYRPDINHGAAIAEEVARLYGYNKIPSVLPSFNADGIPHSSALLRREDLRHRLSGLGFTEMINYSFLSGSYLGMFYDTDKMIKLMNPLSEEMSTLRPYIFPSLIKSLESNWNQGERFIRAFEISSVFRMSQDPKKPAEEPVHMAFASLEDFMPLSWSVSDKQADTFFYMKGVCDNILSGWGITADYKSTDIAWLHPGKSAGLSVNGVCIGFIGALHPDIIDGLGLKFNLYIAELDFDKMCGMASDTNRQYKPFSRYPVVSKDISLVVPKRVPSSEIYSLIYGISPLVQSVTLFDIYTGEGVDASKESSMTYRITFSSLEKTLTDDEINPLLTRISTEAEKRFDVKLR